MGKMKVMKAEKEAREKEYKEWKYRKEKRERDEKEAVVKAVKCHKCDVNLEDLLAGVVPHLEDKHQDFLDMLYTIFPPAKKRMPQFIDKAASKFELRIETAKE